MAKKTIRKKTGTGFRQISKKDLLLLLLSAVCLNLSFLGHYLGCLAWAGFVPFLICLHKKPLKTRWVLSFIFGCMFFSGLVYWIAHVSIIGLFFLVLYLSLGFSWFGVFAVNIDRPVFLFLGPLLLLILEKFRGILFGGFLWGLIGYTQFQNIWLIQCADILGVWGISFLVMLVNIAIAQAIIKNPGFDFSRLYFRLPLVLLILCYGYGLFTVKTRVFPQKECKISIIQPNIAQEQKWDPSYRVQNINTLSALTLQAAKDSPDLIIWPETSAPGYLLDEPDLYRRVVELSKTAETHLLVGAPREDYDASEFFNSVFLFGDHGNLKKYHDKIHLVPFGEYIPYKNLFGFLNNSPIADFSAGKRHTVFQFFDRKQQEITFGVLICFEDIFPSLVRKFRKNGADFLVTVTNEAWFGKSSEPIQHTAISVFRAVENRCWFLRSANTGISCFIDPLGNIRQKVIDPKTDQDIFVQGVITAVIK